MCVVDAALIHHAQSLRAQFRFFDNHGDGRRSTEAGRQVFVAA
jgi:hypothetical protein